MTELVSIDPVPVVIDSVVGRFVMPSQWRHLAKGRFVDTKGADGCKRIFVSDVIPVDAVDVGGSVAFIQVARVAIVVDPVVKVPSEGQSVITVKVFGPVLNIPRRGRGPAIEVAGETHIRVS